MCVDVKQLEAVTDVVGELKKAREKFGPFSSAHEGIAVIEEEFIELREEVFLKNRTLEAMRLEAKQLAAMALRFMLDVCG